MSGGTPAEIRARAERVLTGKQTGQYKKRDLAHDLVTLADRAEALERARRPHKCPVCNGIGSVHAGFYMNGVASNTRPVECRTCEGKGVVWS